MMNRTYKEGATAGRSFGGFTLVETLIAIAIISIAITGPFQVVQSVLQTSYTARDELIAAALAQEGMEYVRQVRDSNGLYNNNHGGGRNWLEGFNGTAGPDCFTNACVVDVGQQTKVSCGNMTCTGLPLYLSTDSLYTQVVTANPTRFTRKVNFANTGNPSEALVTVTVSWTYHGAHSVVLTEDLTDWL